MRRVITKLNIIITSFILFLPVEANAEGNFFATEKLNELSTKLMFIVPIISLIICILLWCKYGKDKQIVETVEFYPPEGLNSLDVGFLYKGKATEKAVVSLLIYLANKGYIKICEGKKSEDYYFFTDFTIHKLKEYDGDNENERLFLEGLSKKRKSSYISSKDFSEIGKIIDDARANGESIGYEDAINIASKNKEEKLFISSKDLYNNFYHTMQIIIENVNASKNTFLEKCSFGKIMCMVICIFATLFTMFGIPTMEYAGMIELKETLMLVCGYSIFYAIGLSDLDIPKFVRIIWIVFTLIHSSVCFCMLPIFEAIKTDPLYLTGFLWGLLFIIGMIILLKNMKRRNQHGCEMLGKIRGFKNFIEMVEKEKLEELLMRNPNYFYDILPYTYALGVSDKWINKFEGVFLQPPSWYDSPNIFNGDAFGTFISSTMRSVQQVMSSCSS